MLITAAILEFFVIGSLWMALFLVASIVVAPIELNEALAVTNSKAAEALITLIGIPFIYTIGVIMQAVFWRAFYLPLFHNWALRRERKSSHNYVYRTLCKKIDNPEYAESHFDKKVKAKEYADRLSKFLDFLRWQVLHCENEELGRQYHIQLHLYPICYGSILPLLLIGLLMIFGSGKYPNQKTLMTLGGVVSFLIGAFAIFASEHRRSRSWKHLTRGMESILESKRTRGRALNKQDK